MIKSAKVIEINGGQVLVLPDNVRFGVSEVMVNQIGDATIIYEKDRAFDIMKQGIDGFTEDCFADRYAEMEKADGVSA